MPDTDPKVPFEAGIAAFEAGNTPHAIIYLEQARALGLASRALDYNLGVAYYRSGQLAAAQQAFTRLLDDPALADLARYNLGRVALRKGREREAARLFQQVLVQSRQDNLRQLSSQQLGLLAPPASTPHRWQSGLVMALGFEDNPELVADRNLTQEDGFVDLFAYTSGYLQGSRQQGWLLSGLFGHRQFAASPEIRQSQLRLGVAYHQQWGGWFWQLGSEGDYARLGGMSLERRLGLQSQLQRSLAAGQWRLEAGASRISAFSAFPEYDGYLWFAGTDYRYPLTGGMTLGLGYRFENNDRADLRRDGDLFSTSPRRHRLRSSLDIQLAPDWLLLLGLDYRLSRFRDPEQRQGQTLERRREEQWRLRARLEHRISQQGSLFLGAERERNQANLNDRDYRRLELIAGLEWRY